jgi:uncharacterized protein YndB with AHSA1/START domain
MICNLRVAHRREVEMEPSVRREIVFPESPDRVWEALTDPVRLAEWFANEVELELEPGGEGIFRWADGTSRRARFESIEPERHLAFVWSDEAGGGPVTRVELTLAEEDDGTRLAVVEEPAATGPTASALAAPIGEWSWALAASHPHLRAAEAVLLTTF